jgi:hypothetical protein
VVTIQVEKNYVLFEILAEIEERGEHRAYVQHNTITWGTPLYLLRLGLLYA